MKIYQQIKKYFLLLAFGIGGVFCIHLLYLFYYHDAEMLPTSGGTVHIGVHGIAPSIDPLSYDPRTGGKSHNDMLIQFLYRGLIKYDLEKQKIVEDLGNCGIDRFPVFVCELNHHALWNNREPIEIADVVATYDFYKANAKSEHFKSRLEKITVSDDNGSLKIAFDTTDITLINLLFLPILRASDIGAFQADKAFSDASFSGAFAYEDRTTDEVTGVTSISLIKNSAYDEFYTDVYPEKTVVHFFPNKQELEKQADFMHIILDETESKDHTALSFFRPQLFAAFFHSENITLPLRQYLRTVIFPSLTYPEDLEESERIVDMFFGTGIAEVTEGGATLANILETEGYRLGGYTETSETASSQAETSEEDGLVVPTDIAPKKLTHITTGGSEAVQFVSTQPYILTGGFPEDTTGVQVNEYRLQSFSPRAGTFEYRAQTSFANLKEGENSYEVKFLSADGSILQSETVTVYFSENTDTVNEYKARHEADLQNKIEAAQQAIAQEQEEEAEEATIETEEEDEGPQRYLDRNGNPKIITILTLSSSEVLVSLAEQFTQALLDQGVVANLQVVNSEELSKYIADGTNYDVLFTGIHLGIFDYNIFSYFHSGQAKNGFNFSRVRDLTLDAELERLRDDLYYNDPNTLNNLKTSITTMLNEQSLVVPLASPKEAIYTKEGLLGLKDITKMPSIEYIPGLVSNIYVYEERQAIESDKSLWDFFVWVFTSRDHK